MVTVLSLAIVLFIEVPMKHMIIIVLFFSISFYGCVYIPTFDRSSLNFEQKETIKNFKRVSIEYPYFEMKYYGDYKYLKSTIHKVLAIKDASACTTFSFKGDDDNIYLGRNNDDIRNPILILFTYPSDGYASISIVNMGFLGFDLKTSNISENDKTKILYAPYLPFDGMNEYGLCIGNMALRSGEKPRIEKNKETLFSLELVREVLDHAKNTDEAINIFYKYNIYFPQLAQHFLLTDAEGHSVVIEYQKNKIEIIESKSYYQICANAPLYKSEELLRKYKDKYLADQKLHGDIFGRSYYRFITAENTINRNKNIFSMDIAMQVLKNVSFDKKEKDTKYPTLWSVIYKSTGDVNIAIDRNYDQLFKYHLDMKK
jgi:hypothetical protein